MRRSRRRHTRPPDMYDLLASLLCAFLFVRDALPAWHMECQEVREAIAAGADPEQYQRAFRLYMRTGNPAHLRNLKGVKVFEENAAAFNRVIGG